MDMKIISDALTAVTAALGLTEKYGWQKGGAIISAVLLIFLIFLKIFTKKDTKQEEPPAVQDKGQSLVDGAKTEGKMEIEDITLITPQSVGGQSLCKDVEAKEGISVKRIWQETK